MDIDRAVSVMIGRREAKLVLTTKATKEIAKRYGGLEKLGERMYSDSSDWGEKLEDIVWIICLLANQGVQIYNLTGVGDRQPLFTEDEVELMTTPSEIAGFNAAIMEAIRVGTGRNVESDEGKNTAAG